MTVKIVIPLDSCQQHPKTEPLVAERTNIVQAIKDGMPADLLKDDLLAITDRLEKLTVILKAKPKSEPLLHPRKIS